MVAALRVRHIDRALQFLNVLFLTMVVFMPYPPPS